MFVCYGNHDLFWYLLVTEQIQKPFSMCTGTLLYTALAARLTVSQRGETVARQLLLNIC